MFFYPFNYLSQRNTQAVSIAAEKLKNRNLPVEQILDEDELMNDLKYSNVSQLVNHITKEDMLKLLKYVVLEPETDDYKFAKKFPFNASELLSGENGTLIDKFFEDSEAEIENDKLEDLDESELDKPSRTDKNEYKSEENNEEKNENLKLKEDSEGEVDELLKKLESMKMGIEENPPKNSETELISQDEIKESSPEIIKKVNESENEQVDPIYFENIAEETKQSMLTESKKLEKIPIPRYEVLDFFLSFLDNTCELNHVLAGYFAKIFGSLRYNRPNALTKYLFLHKKDYIFKLVNHLNRKAIADTIIKVLTIEACEVASDILPELEYEIKCELINKILDSFNSNDEERCLIICEMFTEAINNKKFTFFFLKNLNLFRKLNSLIIDNMSSEYVKELLKVSNKILETIQADLRLKINKEQDNYNSDNFDKGFSEIDEVSPIKNSLILDVKEFPYIFDILSENTIVKEFVTTEGKENANIHMTFDRSLSVLGIKRLLIFDFIKNMIDILGLSINQKPVSDLESSNEYKTEFKRKLVDFLGILKENNFFSNCIDYFFKFEWNNFYQKSFEKFIEIILNFSPSDEILKHIFNDLQFIDRLIDSYAIKFNFISGRESNPGYLTFVLEISYQIETCSNSVIKSLIGENERWKNYYLNFVEPIRKRFSTNLLYESRDDSNIFKDEYGRESPQVFTIDLNEPVRTQVSLNKFIFQKNFIDTIRKQAEPCIEKSSKICETVSENTISIPNEEYKVKQEFYDNNFWKSPVIVSNSNEEILSELEI